MDNGANFNSVIYTKSFTLLETLVAISVLLVGITGAMTAVSGSIASSQAFKDKLIASNLAQEGIELVVNKRDSNFLDNQPGCVPPSCNPNDHDVDGLINPVPGTDICEGTNGCRVVDPLANPLTFINCSGSCPVLIKDNMNGVYGYSGSGPSRFTRRIRVIVTLLTAGKPTHEQQWLVESKVTWQSRFSLSNDVTLTTVITPWHD